MDRDLLHPTHEHERQQHKLKRLIPTPNSYFMDVKCGGCNETNVVFSHAQSVISCNNCKNVLTKPTGGKCKITEGSAFKVKHWSFYSYSLSQIISKRINHLIPIHKFIIILYTNSIHLFSIPAPSQSKYAFNF